MPLIRDSRIVEDGWHHLADDEPLPEDGRPVTVSLARWRRDEAALRERNGGLGLRLDSSDLAGSLGEEARRFDLICIAFPTFSDGRGFSTARLLRRRYGFRGELRATGHLIRDQFFFLHRVGFDTVEVRRPELAGQWAEALSEISVVYQPAVDDRVPAPRARWQRPAAAE